MCTEKRIKVFRGRQAWCKNDEKNVEVGTCELDELVCKDDTLSPLQTFTFIYATLLEQLGFRLPFNAFEKGLLILLNGPDLTSP